MGGISFMDHPNIEGESINILVYASDGGENVVNNLVGVYNFPNPFNPNTTISFNLAETAEVKLDIYDVKGSKIKELFAGNLNSGEQSISWDGKDESGNSVASGVYYYKLRVGKEIKTKKMILLK